MFQARWIAFQIVVAMLTLWWIGTWADITKFGIAPGLISMAVAFMATGLLIRLIDRRRAPRIIDIAQKPQRKSAAFSSVARLGKPAKHGPGLRIGKDIRKLP